jgi:hypothetical protein
MEKRSERSGRFLFLGKKERFNTEIAEEEHGVHRGNKPKNAGDASSLRARRNRCAAGESGGRVL